MCSIRSTGEDYGDDAVGYVQLKRTSEICKVAARITPEHKTTSKPYRVVAIINEEKEEVIEAGCLDCAAAAGTCKHAAAFLGWLERRSTSKAVTSTTSYWKKARLSNVTVETKKSDVNSLKKTPRRSVKRKIDSGDQFLRDVLAQAPPGQTGLIFSHFGNQMHPAEKIGIDNLLASFVKSHNRVPTSNEFLDYCKTEMTSQLCAMVRNETVKQSKSPLWHAVRFARVTASKAYGAAHSSLSSTNNSLVMSVIGASKLRDTVAMERGRKLEGKVLNEVQKKLGRIVQSGIILSPDYPILGASPDGITADGQAVVEIKCPNSEKSMRRYVNKDGSIAAKHAAQVQMLMHMSEKQNAYFCVASPHFEVTGCVNIVRIDYDSQYCIKLIGACQNFWEKTVFQELLKAYD